MRSPDQLRAEVSRLLHEANNSRDAPVRQPLTARAFELAQQAEAIESLPDDVEGLSVRIAKYEHMLDRAGSKPKQPLLAELLRDAEDKLQRISRQRPRTLPRVVAA